MFSISPSALLRYTRSLQEAVATQVVALVLSRALLATDSTLFEKNSFESF